MSDAASSSLELNRCTEREFLYRPVIFLDDMHFLPFTPQPQHEVTSWNGDAKHIYSGSILLTSMRIILVLTVAPCEHDIRSESCQNSDNNDGNIRLTADGTPAMELAILNDIIDTVTGFQRWVTGETHRTVCYVLELLGGTNCVIFLPDETRDVVSFREENGNEKSAAAGSEDKDASEWVCLFEKLTGQPIETCIWADSSENSNYGGSDDLRASTFSWKQLHADAVQGLHQRENHAHHDGKVESLRESCLPMRSQSALCPVTIHEATTLSARMEGNEITERMLHSQHHLDKAIAAHIALIHEEHVERGDLLLRWASLLAQAEATGIQAKPVGLSIATTSLSLRNHVVAKKNSMEVAPNVADEVMQLLAEEEEVARMKFERYTETAQPNQPVF